MRFKEFFIEATNLKLGVPNQPTPPGYKRWGAAGKIIFAPATMTADQVSDELEANPALMNAPTGQGSSITPPPTATPPAQIETIPPGYREFKLPNGSYAAVPQQLNDTEVLELIKRKRPDLLGPIAQSTPTNTPAKKSVKKIPPVVIPADLPPVSGDPKLIAAAKKTADAYLGRVITPQEWEHLLRATFAESGHDTKEDVHILATVLNRARLGAFGGSNITKVLTDPGQFQAVSGTGEKPGLHANFMKGPSPNDLNKILSAIIKYLPKIPKDIGYFTASKEKAYGPGTNIGFRDRLSKVGTHVGDTIFAKMDKHGHIVKPPAPTTVAKK